jgi:group II intron reverse transcriptase/maturase
MSRKPEAEGPERKLSGVIRPIRTMPGVNLFLSSMLEEILDYRNITKALQQVVTNKGAGGVDGMQTDELRVWLEANWTKLKESILEGSYRPSPVRKVEIPKPSGGTRMLGIPTVVDRLIGQGIHQWLSGQYEAGFSQNSYGFREGRSAHQAVERAKQYLEEGKIWIVEMDLDKFFDRVNHDKLMGLLAKRIADKRTLKLIRAYLNSGIMEGGLVSPRTEGTPQGSPLSPILSNIMLDELDKELEGRGHSFVRYADDLSVYAGSEKSAHRVKESITEYIESKLKLRVNREKTHVSQPQQSTLLGFSFYRSKDKWEIRIAPKSMQRIKEKIRAKTKRNDPSNAGEKLKKLEAIIEGWVNYFRIARAKSVMEALDSMVRHRIRTGIWKQWKYPRTRIRNLRKLGASRRNAERWGKLSWGCYRMGNHPATNTTVTNERLQKLGYVGFYNYYHWKTGYQGKLF